MGFKSLTEIRQAWIFVNCRKKEPLLLAQWKVSHTKYHMPRIESMNKSDMKAYLFTKLLLCGL